MGQVTGKLTETDGEVFKARESALASHPAFRLMLGVLALSAAAALAQLPSARGDGGMVLALELARRTCQSTAADVHLPDQVERAPGVVGPVICKYQLNVTPGFRGQGLFIPGVAAHVRIRVNGHVIIDGLPELIGD